MKTSLFRSFLLVSLFLPVSSFSQNMKMIEKNKAHVKMAYESLNARNFDQFFQLVSPEFIEYSAGPMPLKGRQSIQGAYEMYMKAFPDLRFSILSVANEGSTYYTVVRFTGTNSGQVMGMFPATGKKIDVTDVDIIEIDASGKAVSHKASNPNLVFEAIGYGFLTNPNGSAVMDIYKKFGAGDVKGILDGSNPGLTFEISDRVFDYSPRWFKGATEVAGFFKELGSKFNYSVFEPFDFVASGDDVYCRVKAKYTQVSSGQMFESIYTHHFKFKDGKVILFRGMDGFQNPVKM